MADQTAKTPVFDPIKLERLKVESEYPMDKADFDELLYNARYCEMAHVNNKGYPIVTPMFFVVINGHVHMSSIKKYRYKVHSVEARPQMSVCIHNDGMELRHQKSILIVGKGRLSDNEELRRKVHWEILDKYWKQVTEPKQRQAAFEAVHTPLRAIIEVVPERVISWDFGKMLQAQEPGVWFNEAYNFPNPGGAAVRRSRYQGQAPKETRRWVAGTTRSNAGSRSGELADEGISAARAGADSDYRGQGAQPRRARGVSVSRLPGHLRRAQRADQQGRATVFRNWASRRATTSRS